MARRASKRRKVTKLSVEAEKEPSLAERLMAVSKDHDAQVRQTRQDEQVSMLRELVQRTKSFFELSGDEAKKVEVVSDGSATWVQYDDVEVFPVTPRVVYLVWPCPKCSEMVTLRPAAHGWYELGRLLTLAKAGSLNVDPEHECGEVS